jgi:hypothetical protein
MMMTWKRFGRKRSWPNFKILSRNSPGGTAENRPPGLIIEPGTFRIRSRSFKDSTTTVGGLEELDLDLKWG